MTDHHPTIIAYLVARLNAIMGCRGGLDEDLARLDELKRMACLCAALQQQDKLLEGVFAKAGITV